MKILDLSAGNRAVWFDKRRKGVVWIDLRESARPSIAADSTALPLKDGTHFNLVIFDPPHMNCGANSEMSKTYGHHTTAAIRDLVRLTAGEAYRVTASRALLALKWNTHDQPLARILRLMEDFWEPLVGHTVSLKRWQRKDGSERTSATTWALLLRKEL